MKKRLVDCSHLCSKFILQLGVFSFILNDSELKEASNFFQHLKQLHDLAKVMEQEQAALKTPAPASPAHRTYIEPEARVPQGLSKFKKRQSTNTPPQQRKELVTRKSSSGMSHNFLQKDEEGKVRYSLLIQIKQTLQTYYICRLTSLLV